MLPALAALASTLSLVSAHTIQGKLTNLTTLEPGTEAVLTTYNVGHLPSHTAARLSRALPCSNAHWLDLDCRIVQEWIEHAPVLQDQTFKFELIEAGEYLLRIEDM